MLEGLGVEMGPVADAAAKATAVDVVERRVVGPFGFGVVYFESDIRGYPSLCQSTPSRTIEDEGCLPAGLDGRKVHADHFCRRIFPDHAQD